MRELFAKWGINK